MTATTVRKPAPTQSTPDTIPTATSVATVTSPTCVALNR
jgi:hypothetical protein